MVFSLKEMGDLKGHPLPWDKVDIDKSSDHGPKGKLLFDDAAAKAKLSRRMLSPPVSPSPRLLSSNSKGSPRLFSARSKNRKPHIPTSKSSPSNHRARRRASCIAAMIICLAIYFLIRYPSAIRSYAQRDGDVRAKLDTIRILPITPEEIVIKNITHYFLLPPSLAHDDVPPNAVLIVLHECQQTGLDFFQLPEDRIVAYAALSRGMAVLSVSSQNQESGCWGKIDTEIVGNVVDTWTQANNFQRIPRVGLASSSASSFLINVYTKLSLSAMVMYNSISPYPKSHLQIQPVKAIPTAYVSMTSDKQLYSITKDHVKSLRAAGVKTRVFRVSPRPFTPRVCHAWIPEFPDDGCEQIFEIVKEDFSSNQLLDANGYIKKKSEPEQWRRIWRKMELDDLEVPLPNVPRTDENDDNAKKTKRPKTHNKPNEQNRKKGRRGLFPLSKTEKNDVDTVLNDIDTSPNIGRMYLTDSQAFTGHSWLWTAVEQEIAVCKGFHSMTSEHHQAVLDFLLSNAEPPHLYYNGTKVHSASTNEGNV